MIAWRDGKPGNIELYDALTEGLITTNFTYQASGNTLTAAIALADIGLVAGQTIGVSAFQEGSSDGWAVDWMESAVLTLNGLNPSSILVADPKDMADSSGDIRAVGTQVMGDKLNLSMTIEKVAAPRPAASSTRTRPDSAAKSALPHKLDSVNRYPHSELLRCQTTQQES